MKAPLQLWTRSLPRRASVALAGVRGGLGGCRCLGAAYVRCNLCPFYLPTEQLHSVPAASPRAGANPHISVYSDDGY